MTRMRRGTERPLMRPGDVYGQLGANWLRQGARACLFVLFGLLVLGGCDSASSDQSDAALEASVSDTGSSPDAPPLTALGDGQPLLTPVPDFVQTETRAESGIQVAYTDASQPDRVTAATIESHWQFMQSCLELVLPPPLVIIVEGSVMPFTPQDDVLFGFDGQVNASASLSGASLVIQVRIADFDGSLGSPGFHLRSIMGRSLWLSAGLAERDYPFACARRTPETVGMRAP